VSVTSLDINESLLDLLVSLYFGSLCVCNDDRAWYYVERGHHYYKPGTPGQGVLGYLQHLELIEIVDRTKQHILSNGTGKVKFGVTAAGEEVIKMIFCADPYRIIKASQSYLMWVPITVTDVLRYVTNALRSDISRLSELLVSEEPMIRETASLVLDWLQEGK
jgi:hypothetical protein